MNVLVILVPVLAAGVFVALLASRSRRSRGQDGNGDGALYFGGVEGSRDSDDDGSGGDDGGGDGGDGGGDSGGGDGGGGGGGGGGD